MWIKIMNLKINLTLDTSVVYIRLRDTINFRRIKQLQRTNLLDCPLLIFWSLKKTNKKPPKTLIFFNV